MPDDIFSSQLAGAIVIVLVVGAGIALFFSALGFIGFVADRAYRVDPRTKRVEVFDQEGDQFKRAS